MKSFHKALALFAISYVFLYVLYAALDFLPAWDAYGSSLLRGHTLNGYLFVDPLFLFMPFVGFGLMWIALDWASAHFAKEKLFSILFGLGFVVASYVAYFVALIGFYWNNAYLVALSRGEASPGFSSFGVTWQFVTANFLEHMLGSPFFVFVLSALLGWISFVIVHQHWSSASSHAHTPSSA